MNRTPRPTLVTTPPPYKVPLATVVNAFTPEAYPLSLTSTLGKRRLFRHRVWASPDRACPGWLRLTITPGWVYTTPAGNHPVFRGAICREGELDALIERLQADFCVHLWLAPINFPLTHPRGNDFWRGVSRQSDLRFSDVRGEWRGALKAVAA